MAEIKVEDYEILGQFYLGKHLTEKESGVYLYDSRDLTTHAVCIGMTGSGKTGLCIGLLEEAAMDGIPVIAIDPKGDLGNLLLTFPNLSPEEFAPWVSDEEAKRKNLSTSDFARDQAQLWQKGLASWGQDADRIKELRKKADFSIYTPGSSAGRQISILSSFKAPPEAIVDDRELLSDQVSAVVTSLLSLIGVDSDPLTGREHILLAKILENSWKQGKDLDLSDLVTLTQDPKNAGISKIGAFDIEQFFPNKERFELAVKINNLIASSGFEMWLEGEPLDIDSLLYTQEGKPRVTVFSIAHLSDSERMFFVSLLLNQLLGWMRTQKGSSSLRALFYMDEIFGYFPPIANPPSKKPLLTLLKQARAFGLGLVLASQNPGDLDYKGLSNTGTWFIGRLQTERDKEKVLEGLVGIAGGDKLNRQDLDGLLSRLGNRVFLVNNVHEEEPSLIETRWVMSYLRGPFSRDEIKRLKSNNGKQEKPVVVMEAPSPKESAPDTIAIPESIDQLWVPINNQGAYRYRPVLLVSGEIHYSKSRPAVDVTRNFTYAIPFQGDSLGIERKVPLKMKLSNLLQAPQSDQYSSLKPPAAATSPDSYGRWSKEFLDWLYKNEKLVLYKNQDLKETSTGYESQREFLIRLQQIAREKRDDLLDKLRDKYQSKFDRVEKKKETAERTLDREKRQADDAAMRSAFNIGASLLGAFVGRRKSISGTMRRASTAARSASNAAKQSGDVGRARAKLEDLDAEMIALEEEFRTEKEALEKEVLGWLNSKLEEVEVQAKKADINIELCTLAWYPVKLES
ncbi:MAG: DUF87 domain-containing protein [Cyanobacteria bacterium HKST-UBA01]|nr:DUF87 domain-containing protein [Cyanobacteria bacterium HKST-UBA01]